MIFVFVWLTSLSLNMNLLKVEFSQQWKTNSPIQKWAKDLKRHFSKDIQMTYKYMKRCLTPLFIREMQIKITMTYLFIPSRVVIIFLKRAEHKNCWWSCGESRLFVLCWWESKMVQPLWRTVWRFLKKLKIELPYDQQSH